MRERQAIFITAVSILISISGCGGGGDESSSRVTVSIPDPVESVAIDVTIGGDFVGVPSNDPADVEPEVVRSIVFKDSETNTLPQSEIDRAPSFSLEDFSIAFDRAKMARPALAQNSNEFSRAIIAELALIATQGAKNIPAVKSKNLGFLDTFANLNSEEKSLVLLNPVRAYDSRAATLEALAATNRLFTGSLYLTRADAFRHSYWNWLLSRCCSVEWATAFATAHESNVPNNDDKRMDLNNNMVGRRLFISLGESTADQAQSALLDYKLLWLNAKKMNVTVGVDYLVYLEPAQAITVFDDGPIFDDIYTINIAGNVVGDTPQGAARDFEFNQIPSGAHSLDVICKLDGTKGGCGFQIRLSGASTLLGAGSSTSQIVIQQGEVHSTSFSFPRLRESLIN